MSVLGDPGHLQVVTPPRAVLSGTDRQPCVRLSFDRTATHPRTGKPLVEWVKALPGRRWDPDLRCWVVTATGPNPDLLLRTAGFDVDTEPADLDPSLAGVWTLGDLYAPLVKRSDARPSIALVRPRLAGYQVTRDLLGAGATWDRDTGRFEVSLTDLLTDGHVKPGLVVPQDAIDAALDLLRPDENSSEAAAVAAASTGMNLTTTAAARVDELVAQVGDIPGWFGLELYPYQRLGALAAVAGRSFIADGTGLGKTRQGLAAIALRHATGTADRALVVVPPVVISSWTRETQASGLATVPPRRTKKNADLVVQAASGPGRELVVFRTGIKEPALPDAGVVIVPDSLLASRPALVAKLGEWAPGVLVYDEAHRARTWTSTRAETMRDLCARMAPDSLRVAMTATPLFANPVELCGPLAISGHLDRIFGGYSAFCARYAKRNHFNAWVPNKKTLPELRSILTNQVWVRRDKSEVLTDLPPKARHGSFVDVDLTGFRHAHKEIVASIGEWLDDYEATHGHLPTDETVAAWSREQIGLMSPLRKAAGLAKVPVAMDLVADWLSEHAITQSDGSVRFDAPLVVWAHHQEVIAALVEAAAGLGKNTAGLVGVIDGSTSTPRRGELVDAFQAGHLGALVCSITAAGVGITLTRSADALFVETDWTPALVEQAEDRIWRIGQERPATVTTLIAEGTLDERIQTVLARKAQVVDAVVTGAGTAGGENLSADVSVLDGTGASPADIIAAMVAEEMDKRQPVRRAA